jgi:glycosyltransferase involved in cell wall biosynthesis
MPTPTTSIALCTCNGERFLAEQLQSILAQTAASDEIILCDDASEDRTIDIARQYEKALPMRIIRNEQRLGVAANFAKAINACSGDLIFLCDQDDVWEPGKIRRFVEIFSGTAAPALVFSDAHLIDRDSRLLPTSLWKANGFTAARRDAFENGNALRHLLRSNIVTGATAAFRSEFREAILPLPHGWMHDYWIATLLSALGTVHCEPLPLTRYRVHATQQVGIHRNIISKAMKLASRTVDLAVERGKYEALKQRVERFARQPASEQLDLIALKQAHLELRNDIAAHAGNRRRRLIAEIMSGNYSRYSYGWIDILADAARAVRPGK